MKTVFLILCLVIHLLLLFMKKFGLCGALFQWKFSLSLSDTNTLLDHDEQQRVQQPGDQFVNLM